VTLPDGRLIQPDQVLGPQRKGTRFVHVGDVGQTGDLETICRDADTLVIESTYLQDQLDLAHEFAHFTANQAAELALGAGVKNLILTHVSRRYREKDIISEAQAVFPSTHVARDFDHYVIKRGGLQKNNLLEDGK
jgi:ribonuclease Z